MITARPDPFFQRIFQFYLDFRFRREFRALVVHDLPPLPDNPILLLANHISWWDGFWAYQQVRNSWKRNFFVMMLEEQLQQHKFLRKLGAFSVSPGGNGLRRSLGYAADLLGKDGNVLLYFPQGRIHSMHDQTLNFERGISWLTRQSPRAMVLGAVFLPDYFSSSRPWLDIYFGWLDRDQPEWSYQALHARARQQQASLWNTRNT